MGVISIIVTIIVGAIIGLVAGWLMPGSYHYGFWLTALLGIVGSFVGGLIGNLINPAKDGPGIRPAGFVMSVIGAMVVLFLARFVFKTG